MLFCAFLHVTCKSQCYPALCHKNMKLIIRHLFMHYLCNVCMVHSCILTYVPLCVLVACVSSVLISDMFFKFLGKRFCGLHFNVFRLIVLHDICHVIY